MEHKVKVASSEVGLLFAYTSFKLFKAAIFKLNTVLMGDGFVFNDEAYAMLFYCAYQNWCLDKGTAITLKYDDFSEWLDTYYATGEGKKHIEEMVNEWLASVHVKNMIEDAEKKSNGVISTSPISTI